MAGDDLDVTRTGGASAPWLSRDDAAQRPPDRIGPYLLLGKLGEGGMGTVYAAHHPGLDRTVALKLVHPGAGGSGDARARTLREAQALARLSHPNVVQIYEVGEHLGQLFVAMELVRGETLEVWQQAPGRGLGELLGAYRQAALGLRAAHAVGLVHRDFKPANAIVGADGRVRVLDFGLAQARADPEQVAATGRVVGVGETLAGGLCGTPAYMSPEQFAGLEVDARSDVFSLCVALWEALFGERPFAGDTVEALRDAVIAGRRRRPPASIRLPERLMHALTRGLERDPARRSAGVDPLIDALAVDPAADPSAAARERRILFAVITVAILGVFTPILIRGVALGGGELRAIHIIVAAGSLALLVGLAVALRRPLLGNAYHRRMLLFLGALMLVVTSQRIVAALRGATVEVLVTDSAHVVIGMCLTGAIFFARWMLAPAAILSALVLLAELWPPIRGVGMVVGGPLAIFAIIYFWRRDARRLE